MKTESRRLLVSPFNSSDVWSTPSTIRSVGDILQRSCNTSKRCVQVCFMNDVANELPGFDRSRPPCLCRYANAAFEKVPFAAAIDRFGHSEPRRRVMGTWGHYRPCRPAAYFQRCQVLLALRSRCRQRGRCYFAIRLGGCCELVNTSSGWA